MRKRTLVAMLVTTALVIGVTAIATLTWRQTKSEERTVAAGSDCIRPGGHRVDPAPFIRAFLMGRVRSADAEQCLSPKVAERYHDDANQPRPEFQCPEGSAGQACVPEAGIGYLCFRECGSTRLAGFEIENVGTAPDTLAGGGYVANVRLTWQRADGRRYASAEQLVFDIYASGGRRQVATLVIRSAGVSQE